MKLKFFTENVQPSVIISSISCMDTELSNAHALLHFNLFPLMLSICIIFNTLGMDLWIFL